MSRRRKNAGEGYGYMFHGAFAKKADAVAKERKTKGAWVKGTPTNNGYRYIVMSPRTNPIKRKKKAPKTPPIVPAQNPSELMVMAANPHGQENRELTLPAGSTLTIRMNPMPARSADDTRYMHAALAELYPGKRIEQLSARELSKVAMLAAELKLRSLRSNSLGSFFGFSPQPRASKAERAQHRREWKARIRSTRQEMRDELKQMHRAARQSQKQTRASRVFHEVYGKQLYDKEGFPINPAPACGAMIGGYPCTRKPGHRGPHLPQGATMRTRHRLRKGWQPNPTAEALRERFTGKEVDRVQIFDEPHMPAGDYAMLGKLLSLYVKPYKGGQVMEIKAAGGTMIVSDESARQMYFVGGDQDITEGLGVFGGVDRGNGVIEIGEARRIDYRQRKEHAPHPEADSWRHDLGEENGICPKVLFDTKAKRLLLEGGDYRIEERGIIN